MNASESGWLGPEAVSGSPALAAARVAALFRAAWPGYLASLANGIVLAAVLWGAFAPAALVQWLAALLVVSGARLVVHFAYRRAAAPPDPRRWEARLAIGAFAAGALWAYAAIVFYAAAEPMLQMALVFIVGGNIIGAAGVYAASPLAFYGFSVLPYAALLAQLLASPAPPYRLLGVAVLMFGGVTVWGYRQIRRSVLDALETRLKEEALRSRAEDSESLLRDAIESFPEAIAVWSEDQRLAVCNAAYAALYGDGAPPELDSPGPREYRTADGRWRRGRLVRTGRGGRVAVAGDITDLKQAQEAFLKVLDEENLVLETLPVGVAFVEQRVVVRCNRRLETMLGYEAGELQGRPARVLYVSEEVWRDAGRRYEELRGGRVFEIDGRLARKDGTPLWCRLQVRAIHPDRPRDSVIATFTDIEDRREAEGALRRSEALYRNLVETSSDLIWSVDREGRWTYLNPAAVRRIYRLEPAALLGRLFAERSAPEVRERDASVFRRVLQGEAVFGYETRHLRSDGTFVDLSFNAIALRDAQGEALGATGTAHDVTEQKRSAAALHENVAKLRLAVDAADLYYWEWDAATGRVHWGRDPVSGPGPAQGSTWSEYLERVHPDDRERWAAAARASIERGEPYEVEFRIALPDRPVQWFAARGVPRLDGRGRAFRMIGVAQDITERKRQEDEVRFLAHHDSLTGLPNRRLLDDRLRQAVSLAQRGERKVAVMLIDVDDFKQVNDARGHRAGDAVLREVARRLAGCVRKSDTLARQGGDEFVVVLPEVRGEVDCRVVADKMLRVFEDEFAAEGASFRLGASIGISIYPADAGDGEALLRNADAAMYLAKELGRNRYRFYGR